MKAVLFDRVVRYMVEIDERASLVGGSFQGREEDGTTPNTYDKDSLRFVYDKLAMISDPVMLDVGANTGSYSLLTTMLPTLSVFAFEPNPETYEIMCANLALNKVQDRVKTYNVACGKEKGRAILKIPASGKDSGLSCLGDPKRFAEWKSVDVAVISIDDVAVEENFQKVDFIKLDVEGSEYDTLLGAENLIKKYHPRLLIETDSRNVDQSGCPLEKINEVLASWGYLATRAGRLDTYYRPMPVKNK